MPASDNFPDSSIGEGMDITIHGANGHVKTSHNDTQSLRSHSSLQQQQGNLDTLALPGVDDKLKYSDMSIGIGMDLSIHGEGEAGTCKDSYEDDISGGWPADNTTCDKKKSGSMQFNENGVGEKLCDKEYKESDSIKGGTDINLDNIKTNVPEVLYDPVDDVTVEDCCPEICYRVCPCCIGDPDSPFWQLWYRHRLQVSRYEFLM